MYLSLTSEWSTDGCKTRISDDNSHITCTCTHLTNFAALVVCYSQLLLLYLIFDHHMIFFTYFINNTSHSQILQDVCRRTEGCDTSSKAEYALSIVSIVGVTLSLIGLVVTVVTILLFK